ncbi:DUF2461 family protein, partial [candidate division KSB1 bacterium]|nr:DUF2461 family protein [candidate division KSB1 bacterium]
EHYKKMPRGYEAPPDRANFLLYNTLYAQTVLPAGDFLFSSRLVDICMEHFGNMYPLLSWLNAWMMD